MRNIVMARIDERLIHGQVMTAWMKITDANSILVIDRASASNSLLKRILFAAAPKSTELHVLDDEDAVKYLKEEPKAGEKLFVLAKTPQPMLNLIKGGIPLKEVYLGNMGGASGRKRFNKNIFASEEEIKTIRNIVESGVSVYCQMVPTDTKEDIKKLL